MNDTGKFTLRHLAVILLCSLSIIGSVGVANAYALFYAPMTEVWNVSRTAATFHVTVSSVVSGFVTPALSKLSRKIKLRYMFVGGTVLYLIAGLIIANAKNVTVVNIASVFKGIGGSCISFIFVTAIINNWFIKSRGLILGIILSSSGLSTSIMSPLLQGVIDNQGFKTAYILTVMITVCMCAPFALLCPIKPEDVGCQAYGLQAEGGKGRKSLGLELKYFSVLFISLITMAAVGQVLLNMVSHIPSYAITKGFGSQAGAWRLSAVMIGNVAFKLIVGIIIDRFDVHVGYVTAVICGIIGALMILLNGSSAILFVLAGLLYGAVYSSVMVCVPNLYGHYYSGGSYMDAYSLSNLFCSLFSSAVFTVVNYLYDVTGSYDLSFGGTIAAGIIGLAVGLFLSRRYSGKSE